MKHLVQLHEASWKWRSQGRDQGASFTVSLPLATENAADDIESLATATPESSAVGDGSSELLSGLRILLVDDEADARELLSAILTRCGCEVQCCESAAAALESFRNWKPDLLVCDIGMPDEDGYSLITKLRKSKSKRAKEVPAIALTAYATDDDRARALAAGFQVHVAKPIEPEVLLRSIAGLAGRKI